jgi:hypothetical protein
VAVIDRNFAIENVDLSDVRSSTGREGGTGPPDARSTRMSTYLLSVHTTSDTPPEPMTAEELRRGYEEVGKLEADMTAAGAFVFGGRLEQPHAARVVRPSRKRVRATDGPFAETKEHLGGFYLIEAPNLDAALGWASKVALMFDVPVEVRAFADLSRR